MARTALLAGATGLVGGHLLNTLQKSGDYERIIVLTRRPITLVDSGALEVRIVNFDRLSPADVAADDVFCALGTTIKKAGSQTAFRNVDFEAIVNVARASAGAGGKRFVLVSSVGADPNSKNFYLRVKGETEREVATLPFEAIHMMRPSLLLGDRSEWRAGERFAQAVMPILSWIFIGPLQNYRAISAETVAKAMIVAALSTTTGVHIYHHDGIETLSKKLRTSA